MAQADAGNSGDWVEPLATLQTSLAKAWLCQTVIHFLSMDDTIKAYLPKKHEDKEIMVRGDGPRTWRASNKTLKAKTEGITYRAAIDGLKIDGDKEILKWGETVQGDERTATNGDGWIECRIRKPKAKTKELKKEFSPTKACDKLLERILALCPSGVPVSEEWSVFCGEKAEYEKSKRPAKRVPTNVTRFAGNYINVVFGIAVLFTLIGSPYHISALLVVQALALLGDSIVEVFAGASDIEGSQLLTRHWLVPWIRCGLAASSHIALLVMPLRSGWGIIGIILGAIIVGGHAIMRKRTTAAMGVDMVNNLIAGGNGGGVNRFFNKLFKKE